MTRQRSRSRSLPRFEPMEHQHELVPLLHAVEGLAHELAEANPSAVTRNLHRVLRRYPKRGSGFFSRSEILAGFAAFRGREGFGLSETQLKDLLRMKPVRTLSGVTPITVFTKPFPCPGRCVFCPSDVRMPKSYLSDEPGAQRAEDNAFDPYLQTYNRLSALAAIGHPTGKVELIVSGGTWSFYPACYRIWFVRRCFDALNDYGRGADARSAVPTEATRGALPDSPGASTYNTAVRARLRKQLGGKLLADHEGSDWTQLAAAQRDNERGGCRNVGLSVETRPDHIDASEVVHLRRLGCTKVQLGVQSLSDAVLRLNQRGHGVAAAYSAARQLRAAGFKLQLHFMPNLLGSDPESDKLGYRRLFEHADLKPDELKLYPCSLVQSAELVHFYENGQWRPYTDAELLDVLTFALQTTPRYCRLSRVIRDICSHDIMVGNKRTNFRQIAEQALAHSGVQCEDIRSRELRTAAFHPEQLRLRRTEYKTGIGRERFLELVTPDDTLAGFLRLALPGGPSSLAELGNHALLRELHVYGQAVGVGTRQHGTAQHRGLGRSLLTSAAEQARSEGYGQLSVISAVGTRPYYRRHGFVDGELYQHLAL